MGRSGRGARVRHMPGSRGMDRVGVMRIDQMRRGRMGTRRVVH